MATQSSRRRKPRNVAETWWWTYSQKLRSCHRCSARIAPEEVYAFLPLTHSVLCQYCFGDSGNRARMSDRLRVLMGKEGWEPSAAEHRLLSALADGPLTLYGLSQEVMMPMGKVRGLLGHLMAHKRVERDNDKWALA